MSGWLILLGILLLWVAASIPAGLLVGRFIRGTGQHRQDPLAQDEPEPDRLAA
jgi:hypothetical protein